MPAMDRRGLAPDRVTDAPLRSNTPVPLAGAPPLAVLGLMTSPAVAPIAVMLALMLTLLEAVSVSVVLALHETAPFTFTSPGPAESPSVPLVWSTTLVPAFNAALTSVLRTMLPPAFEVQVPVGDCVAVVAALLTVRLYGSRSQVPAAPSGAEAFTAMPVMARSWPEVSILAPLPRPAPTALSRPLTLVAPSDQTTTVPPSPARVASALSVAPGATSIASA